MMTSEILFTFLVGLFSGLFFREILAYCRLCYNYVKFCIAEKKAAKAEKNASK